jgi:putative aminopeptidase FrvX
MLKRIFLFLVILIIFCLTSDVLYSQKGDQASTADAATLMDELEALARIPSVTGRESPAAEFIRKRLGDLSPEQDSLGNLILTLGSGKPYLLLAVPLDEPGYVVSNIQDDGFLRMTAIGGSFSFGGALAHQFHQGQKIVISTEKGPVYGAVTVPSTHLARSRRENSRDLLPFTWQEAFVDVGAESAEEVAELGICLMDTITLIKRPIILQGKKIAAPSIQSKAACIALGDAARRLAGSRIKGTVVLAWTVLETLNGRGIDAIFHTAENPFDEMYIFSPGFGFSSKGRRQTPETLPEPGAGVLIDNPDTGALSGLLKASHVPLRMGRLGSPLLKNTVVRHIGIPTLYPWTPVELVHIHDVMGLSDTWVRLAGGDTEKKVSIPPLASFQPHSRSSLPREELAEIVAGLVAQYGVSRAEKPVREYIRTLLPPWAKPETDEAGNIFFTFGEGKDHFIFIAHMDETGYGVRSISEDGRLVLRGSPGYSWVWEAQAALVHTEKGSIPAVFEPRKGAFQADKRRPSGPMSLYLGVNSPEEVRAMGIEPGKSTVTMPKKMHRIGTHRILARGLDDRAGCAALLEAVSAIDPKKIKNRITIAFSTAEEIGLLGAIELAKRFNKASLVIPVDTFVSSDGPMESRVNAYCPLGGGAVIRVLESANFSPMKQVKHLLSLAQKNNIQVQLGNTFGGTDGGPFVVYGIPSLPLSWPGRYSHSPVEVLDLRDLESLIRLIKAIITQ